MRMPWILGDSREVAEGQRETVQETVDSNPRCSPVTLTALPLPEPSPPRRHCLCVLRTAIQLLQHLGICPFGIES